MLQQQAQIVAWLFEHFHQPVLDFDVVVGAGETEPGRTFQGPLADRVQLANQAFEIEPSHKTAFPPCKKWELKK